MRRLIGLAAAALAIGIAQPALASDLPVGVVDLAALQPAAIGEAAHAMGFDIGTVVGSAGVAQPDYRLHALAALMASQPIQPADAQTARVRRGFGGAMADYYPFGVDGFHFSGGSRFYSRGPARAGVVDARGLVDMRYATLLYAPRSVLARASRRMTPALTAGYTKLVAGGMSLGVEGGAMLGKFDSLAGALVRPPRLRGAGLGDGAGRLNQIARMTFGYHF
jgi:hypothetical protein